MNDTKQACLSIHFPISPITFPIVNAAQIPEPAYGHSEHPRPRQDVVPIDIIPEHFPLQYNDPSPDTYHTLEIILGSATIRVSDKTDPELLSRTLQILALISPSQ